MEPTKDPGPEPADDPLRRRAAERVIGALQKTVRIVGYFSAQHQAAAAAIDELVQVATEVTADLSEFGLRLTGDGLYVGEHRISHYSPTEDPHLFRLFHNGVRQLSFRTGITREDIVGFLEAITADMSQPEYAEEDVVTTLWAQGIVGIRWVVVETFTEVEHEDDPELSSRSADELSSFLDDALRERVGAELHAGPGGEAFALTGGDVRFFQAEAIETLIDALPEGPGSGPEQVYSIAGAECDALMGEIASAEVGLPARFLDAVLSATATTAEDVQNTAQAIGATLALVARQSGFGAIGPVLARVQQWIATAPPDDRLAGEVREVVLGGQILTMAVTGLDICAESDVPAVLSLLGAAPPEAVLRVVRDVTAVRTRDRRRDAVVVLLRRPGGPELCGSLLRELGEEAALDVLDACAGLSAPIDAQPVAISASVHEAGAVRAGGIQMLARAGLEPALPRIAEKIFDPDPVVRAVALRSMAASGRSAEAFRAALQSPEIAALALSEKRLIALLLAHMEGFRAAPLLHMLLARKTIFGAVQNDEVRAAAAAGLGYLPDARALPALERIVQSTFATAALKSEARRVAAALAIGKAATTERDLRALLAPPVARAPSTGHPTPPPIRPPSWPADPSVRRDPTLAPPAPSRSGTPTPLPPERPSSIPPAPPPVPGLPERISTPGPMPAPRPRAALAADPPRPVPPPIAPVEAAAAELLGSYLFEDERGHEYRLRAVTGEGPPAALDDLLRTYVEEPS